MKQNITLKEKHLLIDFLFSSVNELELSVRAANCLHSLNIKAVWQILLSTDKELLTAKSMGKKTLEEIRTVTQGPWNWKESKSLEGFPFCYDEFCEIFRDQFEKTTGKYMDSSKKGITVSRIWWWTTLPSSVDKTIHELYQID